MFIFIIKFICSEKRISPFILAASKKVFQKHLRTLFCYTDTKYIFVISFQWMQMYEGDLFDCKNYFIYIDIF